MYGGTSNEFDMRQVLPEDVPEEFIRQAIEEGQSAMEAAVEWAGLQQQRIESLKAKIAATEAESAALRDQLIYARKARGQHPPFAERPSQYSDSGSRRAGGGDGTARSEVNGLVAEYMALGMTRAEAMSKVFADDPDLREQLVAEANAGRGGTQTTPMNRGLVPTDDMRADIERRLDQRIRRRRR